MFRQFEYTDSEYSGNHHSEVDLESLNQDSEYRIEDQASEYEEEDSSLELKPELIDQSRIHNQDDLKCILDEINCMICFHVVAQPVCCELCEALFCRACIKEWFLKSPIKQICPCCRTDSLEYFNSSLFDLKSNYNIKFFKHHPSIITTKIPKILVKLLSKIKLTCKNKLSGCQEILNYEERVKHESLQCQYAVVFCSNDECTNTMLRHELSSHLDECIHTSIPCRYCQLKFKRNALQQHYQNCQYRLLACKWCSEKKYLCEILNHESDCIFKRVKCDTCKRLFYNDQYKEHSKEVCYQQLYQTTQKEIEIQKFKNSNLLEEQENQKKLLRSSNENFQSLFEEAQRKLDDVQINNIKLENENHRMHQIIADMILTKDNHKLENFFKSLYEENVEKLNEMKLVNQKLILQNEQLKMLTKCQNVPEEKDYSFNFEEDDEKEKNQEIIEEIIEGDNNNVEQILEQSEKYELKQGDMQNDEKKDDQIEIYNDQVIMQQKQEQQSWVQFKEKDVENKLTTDVLATNQSQFSSEVVQKFIQIQIYSADPSDSRFA